MKPTEDSAVQLFREFGFREPIQAALDEAGFASPTPIQRDAIPPLLEGGDLIGIADTGTGKTLAFLLPIFQRLEAGGPDPQALIVCPTRELAIQVAGEAERFGKQLGVRTVLVYGGTSSGDQKRLLGEGCDLVVGTPGRLLDFVGSAWLSMRKVRFVVLDEADRMLDMGFINDVDAILRRSPMSRQTMLFSATVPDEIRKLAERYLFHPKTVRMHEGTRVTRMVHHVFYPVQQSKKEALMLAILERENPHKALIFTATREATSELATALRRRRYSVVSLSSLLSQANRERALDAYREGQYRILVATDVAARGLDITDIDLVINFDVPTQPEDYVHRIGRTGRMERRGKAITLVSPADRRRAADVERMLGEKVEKVDVPGFAPDGSDGASAETGDGRRHRSTGPRRKRGPGRRGPAKGSRGGRSK